MSIESKALDVAAEMLTDFTGTCPSDTHGWEHPKTCEVACASLTSKCWKLYLLQRGGKKRGKG